MGSLGSLSGPFDVTFWGHFERLDFGVCLAPAWGTSKTSLLWGGNGWFLQNHRLYARVGAISQLRPSCFHTGRFTPPLSRFSDVFAKCLKSNAAKHRSDNDFARACECDLNDPSRLKQLFLRNPAEPINHENLTFPSPRGSPFPLPRAFRRGETHGFHCSNRKQKSVPKCANGHREP